MYGLRILSSNTRRQCSKCAIRLNSACNKLLVSHHHA